MRVQIPPFTPSTNNENISMELTKEDHLGRWFRTFEYMRSIGKVYTLEEIELYTKENPNKVFQGDIVPSKDDDYLVYTGEKWMYLDDFNNMVIEIRESSIVKPFSSLNETKNTK